MLGRPAGGAAPGVVVLVIVRVSAWLPPQGPMAAMEVLATMVIGLIVGFVIGVGRGRSLAVVLAPVAFIANIEQAARSVALGPKPLVRPVPQLLQVLDSVVILASLVVLVRGFRLLRPRDTWLAFAVGALLGGLVPHTGFHPLLAWTIGDAADGLVAFMHGTGVAIALLGIVWLLLRPFWGQRAPWLAGIVTLLVHTFAPNGELLLADPCMYLAFGLVLAVVWGIPTTILALRRDLECVAGFHWVQDAVRFLGGL